MSPEKLTLPDHGSRYRESVRTWEVRPTGKRAATVENGVGNLQAEIWSLGLEGIRDTF